MIETLSSKKYKLQDAIHRHTNVIKYQSMLRYGECNEWQFLKEAHDPDKLEAAEAAIRSLKLEIAELQVELDKQYNRSK